MGFFGPDLGAKSDRWCFLLPELLSQSPTVRGETPKVAQNIDLHTPTLAEFDGNVTKKLKEFFRQEFDDTVCCLVSYFST